MPNRLNNVSTKEDRPEWSARLRREREARDWTQADVVSAMRILAGTPLPEGLLDQWKRWERGRVKPDEFYRRLIAAVFGTVEESIFRPPSISSKMRLQSLLNEKQGQKLRCRNSSSRIGARGRPYPRQIRSLAGGLSVPHMWLRIVANPGPRFDAQVETIKQLGAEFDQDSKCWFVPVRQDAAGADVLERAFQLASEHRTSVTVDVRP